MSILLISASPHKNGASARVICELRDSLTKLGNNCTELIIGTEPRSACTACGGCKGGNGCIIGDLGEITSALEASDGIIFVTPTYYGGAIGSLMSLLSRLLYSEKRHLLHKPVASVGVGRRGCISGAVDEINRFFHFTSSPIVTSGYPPIVYAVDFESAERDAEGLQNIRSLARNMHWLTKCIELGRSCGILQPTQETKILTDISSLTGR